MTEHITILMVDDEKRFQVTTQKILVQKGFQILLADSGEDAVKKIAQNPDVVVLDIKMPGMDGHETLKEIKKIKPSLPVIMLTGHGDTPSARQALIEGAFDYLAKPCDIDLLAEKIREAFYAKDTSVANEALVMDVMIPITEYTFIDETKTVQDAIEGLKKSFISKKSAERFMETGHRSILIMDHNHQVKGILTIRNLMEMLLPRYLFAPKPSLADNIEYSPMFWKGMFSMGVRQIKNRCIRDVMSPSPLSIDGRSTLMEAAHLMLHGNERRLIVTLSGKTAGVIREQDLFFEMEKIMNS